METLMKISPRDIERRVDQAVDSWERQCPQQSFGDVTLDQHKLELTDYYDTKAKFAAVDAQWDAIRLERNAAYLRALEKTKQLASSVKGHPKYGENSALYSAMGYVPASERGSGLTRRREAETTKAETNGAS
jgi:hypothetical protein